VAKNIKNVVIPNMTKKNTFNQINLAINKSKNILISLHPGPDEDSIGSCLSMYWYLKSLNKNPVVLSGDSSLPAHFSFLPGSELILAKNIFQIDLNKFDLLIALDQSSLDQISKINLLTIPNQVNSINIDHHQTNTNFAKINFVDSNSPATCQILYQFFKSQKIEITPNMAINLFAGIWSDSQFKYPKTTFETFKIASNLTKIYPNFPDIIFQLENNQTPGMLIFKGLALKNIHKFYNDNLVVSVVSHQDFVDNNLVPQDSDKSNISNILKSVIGWNIAVTISEIEVNVCNVSLRTRDSTKFDVSKIAKQLGGGGHPAASGARLNKSAKQSLNEIVKAVKLTFPNLDD